MERGSSLPMLLSELLNHNDFKDKIEVIGSWKTNSAEYVVLGRHGRKHFPMVGPTHLVDVSTDENPDIPLEEEFTIRRRLSLKIPHLEFENRPPRLNSLVLIPPND